MNQTISKSEMIKEMFIGTLKAIKVPKDYFIMIGATLQIPQEQWALVKWIYNSDLRTLDLEKIINQVNKIHQEIGSKESEYTIL